MACMRLASLKSNIYDAGRPQTHVAFTSTVTLYLPPCRRSGAHLSAAQRELMYDMYCTYESREAERYEWDIADLTARCYRYLVQGMLPAAARFNYIYVDEVC